MSDKEPRSKPTNFLEIHAANQPDKTAIIGFERSLTYGQLCDRARALAKSLYGLGIRPGDQIAIMTYNLPEYAELAAALIYLEVGLVRVGYHMRPPEIEFIVDNSDSKLVVFWHEFAERILPYRKKYKKLLPDGFISFGSPSMGGSLDFESLIRNPPDIDLDGLPPADKPSNQMIYTSGTTGKPKGATRKSDFVNKPGVMEYLFATINLLKMDQNEVHLVCCPLYHSAPGYFALLTFILGGTSVYQSRFDAEQFLELVDKHKVTSSAVVPTIIKRLLNVPEEFTKRLNLTTMRSIICGSAPFYPDDKLAFLERYGPCLYEHYGATETGLNTFITPAEIRERPSSVGKAFADNELIIYDDSGDEVPDGESGVLYMYNSIMIDGYYNNQKATADSKRGKYFTAGDVAIRDSDGYYYIVDRIKDMIIRGGVNIYPAEIEKVLNTMPDIADTAVVGKPDSDLGETVTAFIVREGGARVSESEILAYCKEKMANYKVPAMIMFIDKIPRTLTGKIMKKELRKKLESTL